MTIETGDSQSVRRLVSRTFMPARLASEKRCYSITSARQMVQALLNTTVRRTVPVKFVTFHHFSRDASISFGPRYVQGCAIVAEFGVADDGQTFLVHLDIRS